MVGGAIALGLVALSFVVAPTLEDPGHSRYHAVSAIVLLGVAWSTVVRGPATIARRSVAAASVVLGNSVSRRGGRGLRVRSPWAQ